MDREKEIEEMAKAIAISRGYGCDNRDHFDMSCPNFKCGCIPYECAEILYNADYRKQEWISVDERLPNVSGKYICGVKGKNGNTWTLPADWSLEMKTWFGEFGEIKNMVTHWMRLPEPPKGE